MRTYPALLCWMFLGACSSGALEAPCLERVAPVEPTDSSQGFSAQDVVRQVQGRHETRLASHDAEATGLILDVDWQGETPSWASRQPGPTESLAADGMAEAICADSLVLPVMLAFRTADGRFDEKVAVDLQAISPDLSTFQVLLDPRRLEGAYTPQVEHAASISLAIEGSFTDDGTSGVVRLIVTPDDGSADQSWAIAAWPAG